MPLGIQGVARGPMSQIFGKLATWPQVFLMHVCEVWGCQHMAGISLVAHGRLRLTLAPWVANTCRHRGCSMEGKAGLDLGRELQKSCLGVHHYRAEMRRQL